jgi:glycosyltransferase involved in cell wall biosynthesis
MIVHQVLSGAGPVDAVTSQARAFRRLFRAWGWAGGDHAVWIDRRLDGDIRQFKALKAQPDDVVLMHYSAYAPKLRALLDWQNPKLMLYHNVTPARWFWRYEPTVAVHCSLGRRQLPEFARAMDLAAGVSQFNADELAEAGAPRTAVIPILFDPTTLDPPGEAEPPGPPTLLFVGRLAPHKRQDELIAAFSLYRRYREPDARLVLVGEPLNRAYLTALEQLAEDLAPGAVTIESGLSPRELWARYRAAHAFVCLSEHEGFCVPLLEAFHFGVPVIARPVGGVPEVAGDAALLVDERDPALTAELIALLMGDRELRDELRRRGRERLVEFAPEVTAAKLREGVESVVRIPQPR